MAGDGAVSGESLVVLDDREVAAHVARGVIVGYRRDGLFNRMLCLLNVLRVSEVLGIEPRFLWEMGPSGDHIAHGQLEGPESVLDVPCIEFVHHATPTDRPPEASFTASHPVRLPDEDPAAARAHLRRVARDLRLADGGRLGDRIRPGAFHASMHVRQGDARVLPWLTVKYFPERGWMKVARQLVTEEGRTAPVFVASDSPEFLTQVRRRFGDRVRTISDFPSLGEGALASDFTEAVLLAEGARLVAPGSSAFSQFAVLLSDVAPESPESVLGIAPVVRDLVSVAWRDYCADVGALLQICEEHGIESETISRLTTNLRDFPARFREPAGDVARPRVADREGRSPAPVGQADVLEVVDLLRPRGCGLAMMRMGGPADGGYVVPDDLDGLGGLVSFGVGDDVTFDAAFANRGLPVLMADHTVAGPPDAHPSFRFLARRWAAQSGPDAIDLSTAVVELDSMIGMHGSQGGSAAADLVLKFDVEGAEWRILSTLTDALLARFRIIVCELHGLDRITDPARHAVIRAGLETLTTRHTVVHLHANNNSPVTMVRGVPLPSVVEVTLLRHDRAQFAEVPVAIPGPVDAPNRSGSPDIHLTAYGPRP
jgi:hypothetical protein